MIRCMYSLKKKKNIVCRYISALSHQIFLSLSNMNKVEDDKFILVSQFSKLMSITRQIQHLRNIFFCIKGCIGLSRKDLHNY